MEINYNKDITLHKDYSRIRSVYHDHYSRFYMDYKSYVKMHVLGIQRIYENNTICQFYYGEYTFDLKYRDGNVYFYCHSKDINLVQNAELIICRFFDFTPDLFVKFVLYESETNDFKNQIIKQFNL